MSTDLRAYVKTWKTYDSKRFNLTTCDTYLVFATRVFVVPYTAQRTRNGLFLVVGG